MKKLNMAQKTPIMDIFEKDGVIQFKKRKTPKIKEYGINGAIMERCLMLLNAIKPKKKQKKTPPIKCQKFFLTSKIKSDTLGVLLNYLNYLRGPFLASNGSELSGQKVRTFGVKVRTFGVKVRTFGAKVRTFGGEK